MKRISIFNYSFVLFFILIVSGCQLPYLAPVNNEPPSVSNTVVEQNSSLFESENMANDSNYTNKTAFFTNDIKYINSYGYTLWSAKNRTSFNEPIKMRLCKISGNSSAGYGIVFCEQIYENSEYLLTVMINTLGQYLIGKYSKNEFTTVSEWKSCNSLLQGTGINNEIEISYANDVFHVKINGADVDSFSVEENISIENRPYGYVVVISNDENLPTVPVSVVFYDSVQ